MKEEKIDIENLLVVVDDLALPFGTLRLKPKGSNAGHNGLKTLRKFWEQTSMPAYVLASEVISKKRPTNRIRIRQIRQQRKELLPTRLDIAIEIIKNFA